MIPPNRRSRATFVGRAAELRTFDLTLDEVWEGRGRLLLLSGEPGIGKTRLCEELAGRVRQRSGRVLWGTCYDGEWAPPFGPFAEAIAAPTLPR